MGVALGISNDRLEGIGEGQRLLEAVSREVGGNWSWSELIQSLEGAGQSELAKRITINKSKLMAKENAIINYPLLTSFLDNIEQPTRHTNTAPTS